MKISIVTVMLNPQADFALTAESILAQTHADKEWVVLDGSSWSDEARNYIARYRPLMDQYRSAPDDGVYAAMNDAVELATGDYVVFLNAGDIFYREDTLADIAEALKDAPDILYGDHDYVSGGVHHFRRAGGIAAIAARLKAGEIGGGWHSRFPCHQATFYRRGLFDHLKFDPRLRIVADHNLMLAAHSAGYDIRHADITVCRYYGGGFSAQLSDRCRAEWASVYGGFSDYPHLMLKKFMGEKVARQMPDASNNLIIGGHFQFEGSHDKISASGFAWAKPGGLSILSCVDLEDAVIRIKGFSRFAQTLTVLHPNKNVSRSIDLEAGDFDALLKLRTPVASSDPITIVTDRAEPLGKKDTRIAGWAFISAWIDTRSNPSLVGLHEEPDAQVVPGQISPQYCDAMITIPRQWLGAGIWENASIRLQVFQGTPMLEFRPSDQPEILVPDNFHIDEDDWGQVIRFMLVGPDKITTEKLTEIAAEVADVPGLNLAAILLVFLDRWTEVKEEINRQAPEVFELIAEL